MSVVAGDAKREVLATAGWPTVPRSGEVVSLASVPDGTLYLSADGALSGHGTVRPNQHRRRRR